MNISLFLQMAADADANRIGIVCDGRRWSYGTLLRAAQGAATLIRESGCTHVSLLDESSEAAAIALFGAALAGIPYVPLNYRLADEDLAALLSRIAPGFIVGDVGRVDRLAKADGHTVLSRADFVSNAERTAGLIEEGDEDIAVQLFTSGTTAAPKAAILRHSNLVSYIVGSVEFGSATEDEARLVSVPPYHIAGIASLLSTTYAMRKIVMLSAFDPDAWLAAVAAERVTSAFLVPTMLGRVIARLDAGANADLSSLQSIAYGGGPMPRELIDRALDLFPNVDFANSYGLTETSSTIAILGPEEHREAHRASDPKVRARLASVGRPLPTVEIEIRDEEGRQLPAGERGEVYVRGDQVSGEYRERSALDAQGWFPTRDAGYMDEEGYLFLAGRADDVICRGGENMSPGEIEDAAAVAVPSLEWGEAVGVALVARPGHEPPSEEEVKKLVKDRLRSSRVPEKVLVLDALPYNEMGKLLRREVRSLFKG